MDRDDSNGFGDADAPSTQPGDGVPPVPDARPAFLGSGPFDDRPLFAGSVRPPRRVSLFARITRIFRNGWGRNAG